MPCLPLLATCTVYQSLLDFAVFTKLCVSYTSYTIPYVTPQFSHWLNLLGPCIHVNTLYSDAYLTDLSRKIYNTKLRAYAHYSSWALKNSKNCLSITSTIHCSLPHVFGSVVWKNDVIGRGDGGCSTERLTRCDPKWTSECYLKHLVGTTSGLIVQVHPLLLCLCECSTGVWRGYILERWKGAGEWPSSNGNRPLKSAIFS